MNQTLCLGGISPSQLGRERASPAGAGKQHPQQASVSAEEVRGEREAAEGPGAEAEGAWTSGLIILAWGTGTLPGDGILPRNGPFCLGSSVWELGRG